jgi:hypothetical protein
LPVQLSWQPVANTFLYLSFPLNSKHASNLWSMERPLG